MTQLLENPEVDLELLSATRMFGAVVALVGAWFGKVLFDHSAAPLMRKLGAISLPSIAGIGGGHPFGFLATAANDVDHFLTGVVAGCERAIVHSFGAMLWAFYDMAFSLVKLAYDTNTAIDNVWHRLTTDIPKVVTHTIVKPIATTVRTTVAITKAQFNHLTHRVDTIAARIAHLTVATGHAIAQPFPRIGRLEKEAANTAKRVGKLEKRLGSTALAALVVGVLAKMGLGWIRCNAANALHKKRGCNLWNMMDDLFGLFLDVAVIANICQVIPWLEEGFSLVATPVIGELAAVGAGLCDASYAGLGPIEPPALHVPPVDGTLYVVGV